MLATATNVRLLPQTDQLRALHTAVRDRNASPAVFVLGSRRIIRLLLDMRPGMPVGKILIQRDRQTLVPRLYSSSLPPGFASVR